MHFPFTFKRWQTTPTQGLLELGSDTAALITPNIYLSERDNVFEFKSYSNQGNSIKRIAVGFKPPSGTPSLQASIYVYDTETQNWYLTEASKAINSNTLTYFDIPSLFSNQASSGSISMALIVDAAAVPAGNYFFALSPILN